MLMIKLYISLHKSACAEAIIGISEHIDRERDSGSVYNINTLISGIAPVTIRLVSILN